ncbi:Transcriptional regulator, MarR family [Microbacterium esteraromaticum]|uniref:Transcriptional regulator, MarR family n=1 Tax=Microbacterium esteraromaticum TaxID=57043 RepID=A0A1R4KRG2_9MICO|nr:MarR family transcriptional regulator [Microbacterium esteraromaticum]SJN46673.1 Transcriptional regulator, MarR family [Microbacterium esteraromaticum]
MSASPDPAARASLDGASRDGAEPAGAKLEGAELDQAVTRVEHELGRLFARIRIGWRDAAATVHPDLQPVGYQVLTSIANAGTTSAGAIIERLQVDKSVVSRQLRQLEQLGLVESIRDPDDRRARLLVVTDLAKERIALARAEYEGRIGDRLSGWSATDLEHFADLLGELGR